MEKKKNKIWKKLLVVVIILIIVFAICVTRKFIILSKLVNASKEFENKTNYLATVQSLQSGNVNIMKSYNKDGSYLSTIDFYSKDFDFEREITVYHKDNEQIGIIKNDKEKTAIIDKEMLGVKGQVVNILSVIDSTVASGNANILQKLLLSMMARITNDDYNGKDCYLIELNGWKMWIDKETGLIIREINGGMVTDRFYEFDVVKDEQITKPDISDCKIQENK